MLIALTGLKGSGKDSFARGLYPLGFAPVRFADTLKRMLGVLLEDAGLDKYQVWETIEGAGKETPLEVLGGKSARYAMQTLGTEWRELIDERLWSRIVERRLQEAPAAQRIVITDLRFPHEREMVKCNGGWIGRIVRPLCVPTAHTSEAFASSLDVDFEITNDGTLGELEEKARALVKDLSWAEKAGALALQYGERQDD